MKKSLIALGMLLLAACGTRESGMKLLPAEAFETTVDGKPVALYTLRAGDIAMQVTNYGARVVSLWTPDREGRYEDIVLGCESIDRYLDTLGERFLGAVVGPYANRIAKGRFTLDGTEYTLPLNNNGQTLHGGLTGVDRVVWDVVSATDDKLVLHYLHPDGQDGFPGNLDIEMIYSLTPDNEFRVDYKATTDKPTVANFSHHPFFNLKGEGNGTVLDNVMTINASHTTPVDSVLIPTGEIAPVEGTPFDFREPHTIGERIGADNAQLRNGGGYDHNWVIDRKTESGVELAATVWEPASGRTVEVWSDQPGLQVYSGNFFDGKSMGKYGKPQRYRESLALETQKFPDSPNQDNFPSTVLRPGQTYTQTCIYKFGVK
ncbi:aldose epimerase family protein [uncultured Alistipes sp.]|jgi:aldose 1-epimerase|uniref:aldose epimerase family protein n=1 Tax=Alistipes sp. TaxID=1872444 RepID=UPI0025E1DEB0|nr:aldose epimerase family protein [uncultured Alistipes sp.]